MPYRFGLIGVLFASIAAVQAQLPPRGPRLVDFEAGVEVKLPYYPILGATNGQDLLVIVDGDGRIWKGREASRLKRVGKIERFYAAARRDIAISRSGRWLFYHREPIPLPPELASPSYSDPPTTLLFDLAKKKVRSLSKEIQWATFTRDFLCYIQKGNRCALFRADHDGTNPRKVVDLEKDSLFWLGQLLDNRLLLVTVKDETSEERELHDYRVATLEEVEVVSGKRRHLTSLEIFVLDEYKPLPCALYEQSFLYARQGELGVQTIWRYHLYEERAELFCELHPVFLVKPLPMAKQLYCIVAGPRDEQYLIRPRVKGVWPLKSKGRGR